MPSDTQFDAWEDSPASLPDTGARKSPTFLGSGLSWAVNAGGSASQETERVRCIGRTYTFGFVPSGFFGRIIVRVLNSLSVTSFIQSSKNTPASSNYLAASTLTSSIYGPKPSSSSLHPAMQVLWANGLVLKLSSHERLKLEFEPTHVRLLLHYRYAGSPKPSRSWNHVVSAVNNVISEWYQIPAGIDVICAHCLEEGLDVTREDDGVAKLSEAPIFPTTFKFSHCEMEYYRGHKTVKCLRMQSSPSTADYESSSTSMPKHSQSMPSLPQDSEDMPLASLIAAPSSSGLATATVSMIHSHVSPRREFQDRGRAATLSAHNLREAIKLHRKKEKDSSTQKSSFGTNSLAVRLPSNKPSCEIINPSSTPRGDGDSRSPGLDSTCVTGMQVKTEASRARLTSFSCRNCR